MGSSDRRRLNLIDVAVYMLKTPLGALAYGVAGTSIVAVEFGKDLSKSTKKHLDVYGGPFRFAKPSKTGRYDNAFEKYFAGNMQAFVGVPIAPYGSDFHRRVWKELLKIPAGKTATYGDIAKAIEQPKATRAVGLASNCNPISIIVPCHRIIGTNGKLTGYAGGLSKKKWLLAHEQKYAQQ